MRDSHALTLAMWATTGEQQGRMEDQLWVDLFSLPVSRQRRISSFGSLSTSSSRRVGYCVTDEQLVFASFCEEE